MRSCRRHLMRAEIIGILAASVAACAIAGPHSIAHLYEGYRFNGPDAITVAGGHVGAASCPGKYITDGSYLTELDARTGRLVRIISSPKYRFDCPAGFAVVGHHLWVADGDAIHRTELRARTGTLVGVFRGRYYFPDSLVARAHGYVYLGLGVSFAVFGDHEWSSSPGNGETPGYGVQEYDAGTSRLVRTVSHDVSTNAQVLGLTGRDLWIGSDNSAVTQVDARTGAVVRVLSGFTPFMQGRRSVRTSHLAARSRRRHCSMLGVGLYFFALHRFKPRWRWSQSRRSDGIRVKTTVRSSCSTLSDPIPKPVTAAT